MPFNWTNPYPTIRGPLMARNVVSTSQPLASTAGLRMLLRGGNAVDAVIAAAAALTIVEPISNGLGSDLFAILWDGRQLQGLNASGVAPAAWNPEYFQRKHGGAVPMRGWDSVTVPGAVAGWAALSKRYGKLPFADLLAPAIELAERGHGVARIVSHKWGLQVPLLEKLPGFAQAFMPHGRAPAPGERFVMADAGKTLRKIADTHGEAYYRGDIAQVLEAHSTANGGSMTARDLAGYQAEWVDTIASDYAGHSVHQIPPNGQGIAALMALGLLESFDIASLPVDGVESQHLQIEAMKLAFADTYRWVADARAMTEVTPRDLLNKAYLKERATLIDPNRASDFKHGRPPQGGTVYLTAADQSGMMISLIQSNYMGFGSGVVVPGTGISLQNRLRFQRRPGAPERGGGRQAALPHHHSRLPDERRKAADELRRDGRQHAAARPSADPRAVAGARPAAAGGLRRAALEGGHRSVGRLRNHDGTRPRRRPACTRPPHRSHPRRLHGLRLWSVHLEAQRRAGRRLCGGERFAAGRAGGRVLKLDRSQNHVTHAPQHD